MLFAETRTRCNSGLAFCIPPHHSKISPVWVMTPKAELSHAASVTRYSKLVIICSPLVAGSAILKLVPVVGIDPTTLWLLVNRSTMGYDGEGFLPRSIDLPSNFRFVALETYFLPFSHPNWATQAKLVGGIYLVLRFLRNFYRYSSSQPEPFDRFELYRTPPIKICTNTVY